MWKDNEKAPIWEFLGWVLLISVICGGVLFFLEPYSIAFVQERKITAGYIAYAILGIFVSTPNPMLAAYITLWRHRKISSVREFCKLIFQNTNNIKTVIITALFCLAAIGVAARYGIPTGSPWYLFIFALPVMIIGGGVEEIGWRGFLQPALEKRFPFPIAALIVSIIWLVWHLPIWFMPTSNHYGDSLTGFAITIFIWTFIAAAIYKVTKSVFACVMYHAFINAIGAVYDWNALFDTFPNQTGIYIYYAAALIVSICLWVYAGRYQSRMGGNPPD